MRKPQSPAICAKIPVSKMVATADGAGIDGRLSPQRNNK